MKTYLTIYRQCSADMYIDEQAKPALSSDPESLGGGPMKWSVRAACWTLYRCTWNCPTYGRNARPSGQTWELF
jgi:hypothetical protein